MVAPSSEADAESKQKVVVSDSLFDLDDLVIRHREKRRVIMSCLLYTSDQGYPGNLQVEAAFDFDEDRCV